MRFLILNEHVSLVAGRDGYFLVNRKDVYVGRALEVYGEYSAAELAFMAHLIKPGDRVIEVGANIGALTVGLAKTVGPSGRVDAFESQRGCFALLQAQIALNRLGNVHAYQQAVGSKSDRLWVPIVDPVGPYNYGGVALSQAQAPGAEPVEAVTLDDRFGDVACALIKIDVEGMEEDVIRGATTLISARQPLLYVENDRVEKSKSLIGLLMQLGYRLWWHIPRLYNPNNFFSVKDNIYGDVASFNMFCCRGYHPSTAGLVEIKSSDDPHPLARPPA